MTKRALVLSGGGVTGIGWETGFAKGLGDGGVQLTDADLIIGTSAGSVVGAQLALGRPLAEQLESLRNDGMAGELSLDIDLAALAQLGEKFAGATELTDELRVEIGRVALEAKTADEETWVGTFADGIGTDEWPERPLIVTAMVADTAEFAPWDRDSGVALTRAVASSCSVPALFPPVTIAGKRYVDGGLRSIANADLAVGYDKVLIVAFLGARPGARDAFFRDQIDREVALLTKSGSSVEVVAPDEASVEAMGLNPMDSTRVPAAVDAGLRQGREIADGLRPFWAAPVGAGEQS